MKKEKDKINLSVSEAEKILNNSEEFSKEMIYIAECSLLDNDDNYISAPNSIEGAAYCIENNIPVRAFSMLDNEGSPVCFFGSMSLEEIKETHKKYKILKELLSKAGLDINQIGSYEKGYFSSDEERKRYENALLEFEKRV